MPSVSLPYYPTGAKTRMGERRKRFTKKCWEKAEKEACWRDAGKKRPGDASLRIKQLLPDSSVQMRIVNGFSVGEPARNGIKNPFNAQRERQTTRRTLETSKETGKAPRSSDEPALSVPGLMSEVDLLKSPFVSGHYTRGTGQERE